MSTAKETKHELMREALDLIQLGRNQLFTHCDVDVDKLDEFLKPIYEHYEATK